MKYLPLIFLASLSFYFFISPVLGQTFDFQRAYSDYVYNYNQYRTAHQNYVVAKNQYLVYETLTAKNKAISATREMLKYRAEALRTYLLALKMKLAETEGVTKDEKAILHPQLDTQANWLASHQKLLASAGSIEDLLDLSDEFEDRYPRIEVLIYQSLGTIFKGKEKALQDQTEDLIEKTEVKVKEVAAQRPQKALSLQRWLLSSRNRATLSEEKQIYANNLLGGLRPRRRPEKDFHKAQFALKEGNQYLKEAVFYLEEIIREIKYD